MMSLNSKRPRPGSSFITLLFLSLGASLSAFGAGYIYEQVHSFGFSPESGALPVAALLEGADGRLYGSTSRGGLAAGGSLYRLEKDGAGFVMLRSFDVADGQRPLGRLVQDADGFLYGVASAGGVNTTNGVVFRMRPDGTAYQVLRSFAQDGAEGREPVGGLLLTANNVLYGTTFAGGANGLGTVFKMNRDGSAFGVLHSFGASAVDARQPQCTLLEAKNGLLYGTTATGGTNGHGALFRISKIGSGYRVLRSFSAATEGAGGFGGVIQASDLRLYGTLYSDGPNGGGSVYSVNADGTDFVLLRSFIEPIEGAGLAAAPTEGTDGALYVVAVAGGATGAGGVFKMNKNGSGFAAVSRFSNLVGDLRNVVNQVVEASDGNLYVAALLGGQYAVGGVGKMAKDGSDYSILKNFSSTGTDAVDPQAEVIRGTDGFLYGTTQVGGRLDLGTLFRVDSVGSDYAIVHDFEGAPGDGAYPQAGVIEAADGRLYGTTRYGGSANQGTVFVVAKNGGGYAVLHSFTGGTSDGSDPLARLAEGDDGMLYGVTSRGGLSGRGTVFRMNKTGSGYSLLRSFTGTGGDGSSPVGALTQGRDGVFYGVCFDGGNGDAGTLFRIAPDGTQYRVIRALQGVAGSPANPWAGVIEGSDGRLYGTTYFGGNGGGTVFSISKDGIDLRTLTSFPTGPGDGRTVIGGIIEDANGKLWGTCAQGGGEQAGTIYCLNKNGSGYTIAHGLAGAFDEGSIPVASLTLFADGVLYGTSRSGGLGNDGSVFRLSSPEAVHIDAVVYDGTKPTVVHVRAVPGWTCRLRTADRVTATTWTVVASGKADASGELKLTDSSPSGAPLRFYRVEAVPGVKAAE